MSRAFLISPATAATFLAQNWMAGVSIITELPWPYMKNIFHYNVLLSECFFSLQNFIHSLMHFLIHLLADWLTDSLTHSLIWFQDDHEKEKKFFNGFSGHGTRSILEQVICILSFHYMFFSNAILWKAEQLLGIMLTCATRSCKIVAIWFLLYGEKWSSSGLPVWLNVWWN